MKRRTKEYLEMQQKRRIDKMENATLEAIERLQLAAKRIQREDFALVHGNLDEALNLILKAREHSAQYDDVNETLLTIEAGEKVDQEAAYTDPQVGDVVTVNGYENEGARTVSAILSDIKGGVRLDRPVDGAFVSWNIDSLKLVRRARKVS